MNNIWFFLFFIFCYYNAYSQIGGQNTFEFLNLQTSPRINALGGYSPIVIDSDPNLGLFNPALINSKMDSYVSLNYINYHTDINYGSVIYVHDLKKHKSPVLFSLTYLNYGTFEETNEFGELIGEFNSSEYLFNCGFSKNLFNLDSVRVFKLGISIKSALSQLYTEKSLAVLSDISLLYHNEIKRITTSILMRNLGYQIMPYRSGNRENLPFELSIGISNRLLHMPFRWSFTLQHLETLDLTFNNTSQSDNSVISSDLSQHGIGQQILRHCIFAGEFLITKNLNLRFGYNNRRRNEMMLLDRKVMVGFSCGFSFKINRFKFDYSREFHHFSNPVNSIGISTNISSF